MVQKNVRRGLVGCLAAAALLATTAVLPAGAAGGAVGGASEDQAAATGYLKFRDTFQGGFKSEGPDAKWKLFATGDLPNGDGVPTTSAQGLTVAPSGRNPLTGKPAFTYTTGQEHTGGAGTADHVKWYAYANNTASTGYPGFDAVPGQKLTCGSRMAARTYGNEQHPFGAAVTDPQSDLRLSAGAVSMVDFESLMVFDFFVTNSKLYAFYERLPQPGRSYAAFSYAVPVADRWPGQKHDLSISYDRAAGTVSYRADGREVYRASDLGLRPADRSNLVLDLGGTEERVTPRQLSCGIAMFAILDGGSATGPGLVRLTDRPDTYYAPSAGAPTPQTFVDEQSLPGSRLWGQGARLDVERVTVTSF
ncbi:DUF6081 family protein [Kitasatospora sp. NPDC051853]|uniref:DUF6081 family protein n=1 Tax=Kitasatospora sp. NPDC051853 TaxID=3364058 RepID=UPI0037AF3A5D